MSYSAIDGDIADFLDSDPEPIEYETRALRSYLLNGGHSAEAVEETIASWQRRDLFREINPPWVTFALTPSGATAVIELRDRAD